MSNREEIEFVREAEEANYQVARKALGEAAALTQELLDLYQLLGDMTQESGVAPRDEIVCGIIFLLGCRYQLSIASLAILRGHLIDSYPASRRAIEMCAYAAFVKRRPRVAMVWLRAADDSLAYRRFRKQFSSRKLFPRSHRLLNRLYARYDRRSGEVERAARPG